MPMLCSSSLCGKVGLSVDFTINKVSLLLLHIIHGSGITTGICLAFYQLYLIPYTLLNYEEGCLIEVIDQESR